MLRFRWLAVIVLVLAASSQAFASLEVTAEQFATLRTQNGAISALAEVKQNASSYVGSVLEIRGRVVGLITRASGCSIIVSSNDSGSQCIESTEKLAMNPGRELACLATIGEGCKYSLSDLKLIAYTLDGDLRRLETAQRKQQEAEQAAREAAARAAAARAASRNTQDPVSRDAYRNATAAAASANSGANMSIEQMVVIYKNAIRGFNSKLTDQQADTIARSILGFSSKYQLDPRLVCAVILAESNFKVNATSHAGAQGLGQLMPGTAAGLGVNNAYDPVQNIYGSARYIRSMLDRVTGKSDWNALTWNDLGKALAAYNAGPGAVAKHGGIPPYRETQNYVKKVTDIYRQLCGM